MTIRIEDLVDTPELGPGLVLHAESLGHPHHVVTGCAQTELMDPTPFLTPGELVLTTGMGLRFTDQRTWDAYAERMVTARSSGLAFAVGRTHPDLPHQLVRAAHEHGLPLLEVPPDLPLLKIARHVWQELTAARYATLRAGWDLADECARLAMGGEALTEVLARVSAAIEADVTLVEPDGYPLATATAPGVPTIGEHRSRTTLSLPGGTQEKFKLQIDGIADTTIVQPLLGPVAAVLAMQLSYTLASRSPLHSQAMARFMHALGDRHRRDDADVRALAAAARFAPELPWVTTTIVTTAEVPTAIVRRVAWRLRIALESAYARVRFFEDPAHTTFLMQEPLADVDLAALVRAALPAETGLCAWYVDTPLDLDELGLTLQLARRRTPTELVQPGPSLDLLGIAEALPATGLPALATRLLAPIADDATLLATLEVYLRHGGATAPTCQELFIHRNTLAYRLRRLEDLLQTDLGDGAVRATYLLALRIVGRKSEPALR